MRTTNFMVKRNTIHRTDKEPCIVAGSIQSDAIQFRYIDSAWDELLVTAVFKAGEVEVSIPLLEDKTTCIIPQEVLLTSGVPLQVGVYGVDLDGLLVIPTVYAEVCDRIHQGANPYADDAADPTKSIYAQWLETVLDALVRTEESAATAEECLAQIRASTDAILAATKDALAQIDAACESVLPFAILGTFDSYEELCEAHPTGQTGSAYLVYENGEKVVYVWMSEEEAWVNIGTMQGKQGETGAQGEQGDPGFTTSVSAEIHGFVGDGTQSDTEKLQRVFDEYSVISFADKTYELSEEIFVSSDTTILGHGAILIAPSVCLDIEDSKNVSISNLHLRNGLSYFTVSEWDETGGTVTADDTLTVGQVFTTTQPLYESMPNMPAFTVTADNGEGNYSISHSDLGDYNGLRNPEYPIYVGNFGWEHRCISASGADGLTVQNCTMISRGVCVHAIDASDVLLENCDFFSGLDCTVFGESVNDVHNITVRGCRFENRDYGKQGIILWREDDHIGTAENVHVSNCDFHNITETGVSFAYFANAVRNVMIEHCSFVNCVLHAISVTGENVIINACSFESEQDTVRSDIEFGSTLSSAPTKVYNNETYSVNNCTFLNSQGVSIVPNDNVPQIHIQRCHFENPDRFSRFNLLAPTTFEDCTFSDDHMSTEGMEFIGFYLTSDITFLRCTFAEDFRPLTSTNAVLVMDGCSFLSDFHPICIVEGDSGEKASVRIENCDMHTSTWYTVPITEMYHNTIGGDAVGDVYHTEGLQYRIDENDSSVRGWCWGTTILDPLKIDDLWTVPTPSQYESTKSPLTMNTDGILLHGQMVQPFQKVYTNALNYGGQVQSTSGTCVVTGNLVCMSVTFTLNSDLAADNTLFYFDEVMFTNTHQTPVICNSNIGNLKFAAYDKPAKNTQTIPMGTYTVTVITHL